MNEGHGQEFYRKDNSVRRSGLFSEPPDSEYWNFLRSSPSQISAPTGFHSAQNVNARPGANSLSKNWVLGHACLRMTALKEGLPRLMSCLNDLHGAPKSQRFLRFAIAVPLWLDPEIASDFRDKTQQCWIAIKGAMESRWRFAISSCDVWGGGAPNFNQGPPNGGASRSGLVLPFLSFVGLSRFFRDFSDLCGESSGIFPICPFPLSRPINSAYEEQSRNGPRHNLDLSRK